MRRWGIAGILWLVCLRAALPAAAQVPDLIGRPVRAVVVEQEGRPVTERLILGLVETHVGEPLAMRDVRSSIDHLYGLGRFDDIRVVPEAMGDGVRVKYLLVPRHTVQAVEFVGHLALPEEDLRQVMTERFGSLPSAARANDVARAFVELYQERGFPRPRVEPKVEEFHDPDRAVLTFAIESGPRATIQRAEIEGLDAADTRGLASELELRAGQPYDSVAIRRRLERYTNDLRTRGYYEAHATQSAEFTPEGQAIVRVDVERGPHVTIAFAGDQVPANVRDELVPLRREGSVDEDLLEDAARAITDYFRERGYRDADVHYTREERGGELVITLAVRRGPRHIVDSLAVNGNKAIASSELLKLARVERGEPFVQAAVDRAVSAITHLYRASGYTRARVEPAVSVLPRAADSGAGAERRVAVGLTVSEGPRTVVGSIFLRGNSVLGESELRSMMKTAPGRPFSEVELAQDRDRIELEYLNRGYQTAVVEPSVTLLEGDTRAEVRVTISEGPQLLVDHIIIVGNKRTSTETIERALLLAPGQPLGYAARLESQQRLAALGLFRRVDISELRHGSEPRRDVLVTVEEAPPTTVGYGGGLEGGWRLRPTGVSGVAEERFEVAPRGFVEVGRRNLFGKNRSVNLFTRVALRTRDSQVGEVPRSSYGFNEYRVLAAYREPRVFNLPADLLITGTLDQAIRSSFNFRSRELRAEAGMRLGRQYGISGRYSYEQNELFDRRIPESEEPLIDRIFPQVRLSKLSLSLFRDTRNDALDPDRGTFLSADNDVAARAVGSEVGFVKTFLQASAFRRLPTARRLVLRTRGLIGLAQGFERVAANGEIVADLPASERFFAGGDTSVRGFSLDRLGTSETITPSGFPRGGNGLIVLNGELLVNAWRALDAVGFVDAGNVFPRASELTLTDLRAAAGFGVRYRSPVGPIRLDLGFNLDPRELVPGTRERRTVLHVSLGQAF